jgi:Fe-S cluster assembly protein SufB
MAYTEEELKKELESKEYAYGFYTDIESDTFPKGINEEIVIAISRKKEEPAWMTEWRLESFRLWKEMVEPEWANINYKKPSTTASTKSIPNCSIPLKDWGSQSRNKRNWPGWLLMS